MKEFEVSFPYRIGTCFQKNENGTTYIDRLTEYVIKKDGIYVILTLCADKEPRLSEPISFNEFLSGWSQIDSNDANLDKQDETLKLCFGATYTEQGQMFDENGGFNVILPKDNLTKVSEDFNEFIISASKGYSETLANQREEEKNKVKEKTNNN